MRLKVYQEKSKRTLNNKLVRGDQINNMILGINGEVGEITDIFKKHFYQGHDLDVPKVKEELGDVMFYIANLCNALNLDLEKVLDKNYKKLLERYPEGFDETKA